MASVVHWNNLPGSVHRLVWPRFEPGSTALKASVLWSLSLFFSFLPQHQVKLLELRLSCRYRFIMVFFSPSSWKTCCSGMLRSSRTLSSWGPNCGLRSSCFVSLCFSYLSFLLQHTPSSKVGEWTSSNLESGLKIIWERIPREMGMFPVAFIRTINIGSGGSDQAVCGQLGCVSVSVNFWTLKTWVCLKDVFLSQSLLTQLILLLVLFICLK